MLGPTKDLPTEKVYTTFERKLLDAVTDAHRLLGEFAPDTGTPKSTEARAVLAKALQEAA